METPFPHLTATGPAPSYHQVVDVYRNAFDQRVKDGSLRPLVLPYHFYGFLALLAYLCIPHTKRPLVYAMRWPVLLGILAFSWKTTWEVTSMSMATGFAVGLFGAWAAVWSFTWLVLYRPQFDAKRLDRKIKVRRESGGMSGLTAGYTTRTTGQANGNGAIGLKYRGLGIESEGVANGGSAHLNKDQAVEYYWQSYPDNFTARFWWVLDLLANFRGPGWNWAIPPLPSPPPYVKKQLGEQADAESRSGVSSVGLKRYDTRDELFRARMPTFIVGYFLLDALKVTMMKDPYFTFGPTTYAAPAYLHGYSPWVLPHVRRLISSIGIILSLEMVFLIPAVLFSLLCGPKVFGLRAEAWYYPTTWGSLSNITDKGLNGLWGGWWHQTFRFAFGAPSNHLINNGYIKAKSPAAKFLALFFAFAISGFLHCAGSISQFPKTYIWHAPAFFMLQAVGIMIQLTICSLLHPLINTFPRLLRKLGNLIFALVWMWCTGWILTDDFARGGIWLYEPIPISPLRGLSFGVEGDRWWCWEHIGVGWYTGKHWWESGIAF